MTIFHWFRKHLPPKGPQRVYFQWMQCCGYAGMICGRTVHIELTGDWRKDAERARTAVYTDGYVCTADAGDVDALFIVPRELSHMTNDEITRFYLDQGPAGARPGNPWLTPFKIHAPDRSVIK